MRILIRIPLAMAAIAGLALCLHAQDAHAQGMGMGRGKHQTNTQNAEDKPPKADEKAYKDALKRIPDQKVDPWSSMR